MIYQWRFCIKSNKFEEKNLSDNTGTGTPLPGVYNDGARHAGVDRRLLRHGPLRPRQRAQAGQGHGGHTHCRGPHGRGDHQVGPPVPAPAPAPAPALSPGTRVPLCSARRRGTGWCGPSSGWTRWWRGRPTSPPSPPWTGQWAGESPLATTRRNSSRSSGGGKIYNAFVYDI